MALDPLLQEIDARMLALLQNVAAGDDVPPGGLLRLEGLREAAVLTGCADTRALQARMDELFAEVLGTTLEARLGDAWETLHPFPEVPLYMARAPVSAGGSH